MFQDPKCDYTSLLKAASAAEIECEWGKGLGLHSKGGAVLETETNQSRNRDASPVISSVASMESKIDQLTTIVKSAQKLENQKEWQRQITKTNSKENRKGLL